MLSGPSSSGSAISCSTRLGRIMHNSVCKTTHRAIARGWAAPMQPDVRLSRAQVYSQAGICINLSGLKKPMCTLEQGASVSCAVRVLSGHQLLLCEAAHCFQQLDALRSSRTTCSWVMHICGGPAPLQLAAGPHLRPQPFAAICFWSCTVKGLDRESRSTRQLRAGAWQQHSSMKENHKQMHQKWRLSGFSWVCRFCACSCLFALRVWESCFLAV